MTEPTARQLEVLVAWIECGDMQSAADRLGLSMYTVRATLAAVRQVFVASNSAQAFAIAVRRGLVDPNELHIDDAAA